MGAEHEKDRDELINEWMRSNDAFKRLARQYGKGGKPAKLGQADGDKLVEQSPVDKALEKAGMDAKQAALLDWMEGNEAFKKLAVKYGKGYPKPGQ